MVNVLPGRHPRRLPAIMNITEIRALEPERDFQKRVKKLLRVNGWLQFSQPTTQEQIKNEGDAGYPDITAVSPEGRILFIELKKEHERPSSDQLTWRYLLLKNLTVGTYVWRPSDWPEIIRVVTRTPTDGGAA